MKEKKKKRYGLSLDKKLMEEVDKKRGLIKRSPYVNEIIRIFLVKKK